MIGPTPADAAAGFINKLTGAAPLSRERLGKYAGRTAVFHVGPFDAAFTVQTTGEVLPAVEAAQKDLEVRLSPFLLPRLAARDESAFRDVRMTGDADFAAEIAFLAKNLKWDVVRSFATPSSGSTSASGTSRRTFEPVEGDAHLQSA
ncbi:MAG: hypothetical protein IPJ28_10670 [Betaproteobacteria bacterium]|nr:hypothetical protein [Betaproteobacteria bacterium]